MASARLNLHGMAALDTVPKAKVKRSRRSKTATQGKGMADSFRLWMTVALGVGIPCLSLAMSKLAGTLAAGGLYVLAAFALGLMLAVLAVSLPHLAWSVSNITRSGRRASWSLAIALDLSLVLCELIHVYAAYLGLAWVSYAVMSAVAVASMALNVWAFLMHD